MYFCMCNQSHDCVICPDTCRFKYEQKGYRTTFSGSHSQCLEHRACTQSFA